MAKKGAERGGKHGGPRHEMRNAQNRDGSLQKIEEKGQRGQILAAGAQNIGRANIARTNGSNVGGARQARQKKSERNGAASIAEQKGQNILEHFENQRV